MVAYCSDFKTKALIYNHKPRLLSKEYDLYSQKHFLEYSFYMGSIKVGRGKREQGISEEIWIKLLFPIMNLYVQEARKMEMLSEFLWRYKLFSCFQPQFGIPVIKRIKSYDLGIAVGSYSIQNLQWLQQWILLKWRHQNINWSTISRQDHSYISQAKKNWCWCRRSHKKDCLEGLETWLSDPFISLN